MAVAAAAAAAVFSCALAAWPRLGRGKRGCNAGVTGFTLAAGAASSVRPERHEPARSLSCCFRLFRDVARTCAPSARASAGGFEPTNPWLDNSATPSVAGNA